MEHLLLINLGSFSFGIQITLRALYGGNMELL